MVSRRGARRAPSRSGDGGDSTVWDAHRTADIPPVAHDLAISSGCHFVEGKDALREGKRDEPLEPFSELQLAFAGRHNSQTIFDLTDVDGRNIKLVDFWSLSQFKTASEGATFMTSEIT